jgi:HD-like signal output (HDOD) protein
VVCPLFGELKHLAAEAARGNLTFPTSATVLLRVRKGLDDPDCAIETAARLIQTEPVLAARVVAVANSTMFNRSGRTVTDVRAAVNMLGFRMVRTLATAMVVRRMAGQPETPAHRDLAMKLWGHSAHVAALAHLIARRVTKQDPDTAPFAGMVHEIGGFYLLARAKDHPGLLDGDAQDWSADNAAGVSPEKDLGRAVLGALQVPKPVLDGIEVLWNGYLAFPPKTLGDTLLLADQLAPLKSSLFQTVDQHATELRSSIDVVVDEDTLSEILAESAKEVKSLTEALQL